MNPTDPALTREYMDMWIAKHGDRYPWALAFADSIGEPWEDVPYFAFILDVGEPSAKHIAWAQTVIAAYKAAGAS